MQREKKSSPSRVPGEIAPAPLAIDIRKGERGAACAISGVVCINELSPESVTVLSHSGRVCVRGSELRLTVFSGRTVEISGRIEEVELGYGRD